MDETKIKMQYHAVFFGIVTSVENILGSPIRPRRRERRAAVREAIDIGDTTEEAVNFNETITEPVDETEPAENAEDTKKSDEATNL